MPSDDATKVNINVVDTLERLRAEKYPHIPRDLLRELLRLHADIAASPFDLANQIDALVRDHAQEKK